MTARVLLVTSEAIPLAKTGGLADVITALTDTLRKQGVDASILMPGYPSALQIAQNLHNVGTLDALPGGPGMLLSGTIPGTDIPVILLDTAHFRARTGSHLYVDEDGYELSDNALSFAALAHAAMQICAGKTGLPKPHIVHANDWHTGLIPALLQINNIQDVSTVLTIHNLAFQGNFPLEMASALGLPDTMLNAECIEYWGQLSFLKAGIRYADWITTVSNTYAQEILTPRFGHGFEGFLQQRKNHLSAIPNGIDVDLWNPVSDPMITRRFSRTDTKGKAACKSQLKEMFNLLPINQFAPVLGLGSRITHQKMADVALAALPSILQTHPYLQLAILGCGEHVYERGFQDLVAQFPGRVGVHIGYDETHAHVLHAGADMLLHGSRFEPFGLTPIYAMRYGTIPIASRVGGLNDTIVDAGTIAQPIPGGSGVLFDGEQPQDMIDAINRAFQFYGLRQEWQKLQVNAMSAERGWTASAHQYIAMYRDIVAPQLKGLFADALCIADLKTPDATDKKTRKEVSRMHKLG